MPTLADIVQEALRWRGTPYHHAAARKQVGCDCVGLVLGVAQAVGLIDQAWRPPPYSPEWHLHRHEEVLQQTMEALGCVPVPLAERRPGHLLTFRYGRVSSHVALLVSAHPEYVVEALLHERVVHHILSGDLLRRLQGCYALPGVQA